MYKNVAPLNSENSKWTKKVERVKESLYKFMSGEQHHLPWPLILSDHQINEAIYISVFVRYLASH